MIPISLLIFDLDGTLVNTLDDIAASVNHTVSRLGKPQLTTDAVRRYVGDGIETLMVRSLGGQTTQIAKAVDIYKEHHRQNLAVHSSLYPGVKETLEYYKTLPMAVISNKTMEFITPLLESLGHQRVFQAGHRRGFRSAAQARSRCRGNDRGRAQGAEKPGRDRGRRDHGRPCRQSSGNHHLFRDVWVPLRGRTAESGAGPCDP